ncbi:MAG TPA: glycosyltransferase family 2 protein [Pseudonocardiaceae bacterium]
MPKTTVVVVTWRGRELVGACLDALMAQSAPHDVLVVDNASDDGTAAVLAAHPSRPRVLRLPQNRGYAGGLAAALPLVDTPYLAWLNDDAQPAPDWLAELEAVLDAEPTVAAAGSVLLSTDGALQSAGVRLTGLGYGGDVTDPRPDAVFGFCGGAALLRTDALRKAGGVPAGFFCYYEDTDTAWRLRLAGHDVRAVPTARVLHRHGASSRPGSPAFHRWNERNRLLMLLRCAPAAVVVRELARFAAITAALPFRGRLGNGQPAPNHRVAQRLTVLAAVLARLPATLVQRTTIGRRATIPRRELWRRWALTRAPR